ncbi:hypothetical protein [Paraburkholderia caffeinilytica]|uniref:hypothetical protein n=1 Tax=Paraburkholderia caffeinilytica TaxID=1761016 RepID=UPI003DA0449B
MVAHTLAASMAVAVYVSSIMHRYATPFECVLNIAGAFAACAQGVRHHCRCAQDARYVINATQKTARDARAFKHTRQHLGTGIASPEPYQLREALSLRNPGHAEQAQARPSAFIDQQVGSYLDHSLRLSRRLSINMLAAIENSALREMPRRCAQASMRASNPTSIDIVVLVVGALIRFLRAPSP